MTIFELVRIALDQLYAEGSGQYHSKLDATIIENIEYLKKSYKRLNDPARKPLDYKDPATRFAYVYKYVAAHGDYIVKLLEKLATKRAILDSDSVRVSCLGGGPGSDIVGVLKFLEEERDTKKPAQKLTCYILDREPAWADTWTEINDSLRTNVNVNFQPFNIANPDSWKHQRKFLQADLFTLVYFVSEVIALDKAGMVAKSWGEIFDSARTGALFLYIDNGHDDFTSYFDSQWKAAKLRLVVSGDNERWRLRDSEQASVLDDYRKKFGEDPKIRSYLSYRVLRKT